MTVPQILIDVMQLLFDLALPAAMCTMVLAGLALRQEGGVNFQAGGGFQKWIVWSAIFLTLPQLLAWFAGQGIALPPQASRQVTSPWLAAMETSFKSFVTNFIVGKLVPVAAAWAVLKAVLDAAQGDSPLGSIIAAFFLLTVSSLVQMMQGFNSGSQFATVDMLASLWNYVAGTILPEAAGLAIVGAIINYARHRPISQFIFSALAFLSVSALWKLVQAMVG